MRINSGDSHNKIDGSGSDIKYSYTDPSLFVIPAIFSPNYINMLISKGQETVTMEFSDLLKKAKQTILYFYPQDETPGCTLEAITFTLYIQTFLDAGIQVIGVSKDSSESHCKFIEKDGLQIPLISDPDLTLHKQFGARGEKNMYGKIYEGTIRSTFLLDSTGDIIKARRNVKATGHVEKIMKELKLAN